MLSKTRKRIDGEEAYNIQALAMGAHNWCWKGYKTPFVLI